MYRQPGTGRGTFPATDCAVHPPPLQLAAAKYGTSRDAAFLNPSVATRTRSQCLKPRKPLEDTRGQGDELVVRNVSASVAAKRMAVTL